MNRLLSTELLGAELKRQVEAEARWMQSSTYQKWRAQMHAEWMARPWYQRAWLKFRNSQVPAARERLGEIIAGRRFDE